MLERQNQSRSPVALAERSDGTCFDGVGRRGNIVPTSIEIDINPVAYQYESWSEMADGWVELLRSTAETVPDPDHEQIRNVTPLVPLSDVEALVGRIVVSEEAVIAHDHTEPSSSPR